MINKVKTRAIFKDYRRQIAELNQAIEESSCYHEEAASRSNKRAEACRRECEEARRQEESDRWYREEQLRSATKDLERARSYGDEYGESRAIEKIKRLG